MQQKKAGRCDNTPKKREEKARRQVRQEARKVTSIISYSVDGLGINDFSACRLSLPENEMGVR